MSKKYKEFIIIEYPGLGYNHRHYRMMIDSESISGIQAMIRNGAVENYYEMIEKQAYTDLNAKLDLAISLLSEVSTLGGFEIKYDPPAKKGHDFFAIQDRVREALEQLKAKDE